MGGGAFRDCENPNQSLTMTGSKIIFFLRGRIQKLQQESEYTCLSAFYLSFIYLLCDFFPMEPKSKSFWNILWLARGGQGQQDKPVGSEEVNNPQNPRAKSR